MDISIAIIGFGGMANYHVERISKLQDFNIVGIYDIAEKAQARARKQGIHVYESCHEIADDRRVNTVLIATPNDVHAFYAEYFAAAKKHVICEKPAALSGTEYIKMVSVAKKNNVALCVHQNRRWDSDYLVVREIVQKRTAGQVYRIESRVCGANGIPGDWRKKPECGGGMMLDWGVHLLDQLLLLSDSHIISVDCSYSYRQGFNVEDGFSVELEFANGLTALASVDTNCFVSLPRWIICGADGTAIIEDWERHGKIVTANYEDSTEAVGMQAGNGYTKTMSYRPHSSIRELPLPIIDEENDAFYNGFKATLSGAVPIIKHIEVLRVLKLMAVCKKSAQTKKIIKGEF